MYLAVYVQVYARIYPYYHLTESKLYKYLLKKSSEMKIELLINSSLFIRNMNMFLGKTAFREITNTRI